MGLHSVSDWEVCRVVHAGTLYTEYTACTEYTQYICQGLVISLPYCYLSSEVQNVVKSHYNRWQLIRTVGRGHSPSQTSITASTLYSVNNQVVYGLYFLSSYNISYMLVYV